MPHIRSGMPSQLPVPARFGQAPTLVPSVWPADRYPNALLALGPWGYWQLREATIAAADSASPSAIGCGGGHWGQFPLPPPNDLGYGATLSQVPGLLNDTRTASNRASGAGAQNPGAALSWSAGADAPWWPSTGTWFHNTFQRVATPTAYNRLWRIPCEIGTEIAIAVDGDNFFDTQLYVTSFVSGSFSLFWPNTSGPVGATHHHVMLVTGDGAQFSATLWDNGVNMGTQSVIGQMELATGYLSEGVEIASVDGFIHQDFAIGTDGVSAGCAMNDATALSLYTKWAQELK